MKKHVFTIHTNLNTKARQVVRLSNTCWNIDTDSIPDLINAMELLSSDFSNGWNINRQVGPILYTVSIDTHPEYFI